MIKVESGSFAALVRSYKKSLNMLAVLQSYLRGQQCRALHAAR